MVQLVQFIIQKGPKELLSLWMKSYCHHSNEATKQYFSVGLLIMLYKVVLTFESGYF